MSVPIVSTVLRFAADPTPTPSLYGAYTGNPNLITPGVWGFIAILAVAIATIFLLVDMNRRVRRSRYREEVRVKLEEEAAEKARLDEAAARKAKRQRRNVD